MTCRQCRKKVYFCPPLLILNSLQHLLYNEGHNKNTYGVICQHRYDKHATIIIAIIVIMMVITTKIIMMIIIVIIMMMVVHDDDDYKAEYNNNDNNSIFPSN